MNVQNLTLTEASRNSFYPTPPALAEQMLSGLDMRFVQSVLEPSAGKGNLIHALLTEHCKDRYTKLDIDICELDPYLRQICKYEFGGEKEAELQNEFSPLQRVAYRSLTPEQQTRYHELESQIDQLAYADVHIVHDDFLTYHSRKHYDLILMNPPFADGDKHLLHAIELQKYGGAIVCLLNAETIRNPYTATRALLVQKLKDLEAEIEFAEGAFLDAERETDVDVAIIKIHIESQAGESGIWDRMKKAQPQEEIPDQELQALVPGDYIEQAIRLYQLEVDATMELIREYKALSPYITRTLNAKGSFDQTPILTLRVGDDSYYSGINLNKYMKTVRLKYWKALFENENFVGRLTSELRQTYQENISRMADYEFSAFNIKQVLAEMNASMSAGIEKAILDLFDKLSAEHSWYPECTQNRHYFNGWATNKAHKIGKKCIIPTYGMFSSYSWVKKPFEVSEAYKVISDIEKALDYLDNGQTEPCDLLVRLQVACDCGQTRKIDCKYFTVDLYKKGTTHIKFHPEAMPLVERLNIYASRKKAWLPPSYGRTAYNNMKPEEQAVVDSFHGDDSAGSGAEAYAAVLRDAAFYLADPVQAAPALMAAS